MSKHKEEKLSASSASMKQVNLGIDEIVKFVARRAADRDYKAVAEKHRRFLESRNQMPKGAENESSDIRKI